MTEILLVRHGETEWNTEEVFRGRADVALNETGNIQAKMTGEYLSKRKLAAVYSSPLQRALKTAESIAGHHSLTVKVEPDLIDLDFGEWQGMSLDEVKKIYKKLYIKWEKSPQTVTIPGGESLEDARERALKVIHRITGKQSGTVALVTHRVIIKVLICALLGMDNSRFWSIRQDTCGITSFTYTKDKFILNSHNDTSFLGNLSGKGKTDF